MTELTGKQIASTYKQLLKIGVSTNTGVTDTLQTVQSGDGTNSALQIATGKVAILGELSVSEDFSIGNLKVNKINVSACISATNLVAATGSFTTKVSGVAGEFSGTVCAATFDGALTGDVTGDIDGATGSFSACISATNLVAATGSFTTKVSGVAGEFSGTVCAATFDGALTGDVTGDIDGATGSFSACISATNLVAATGSFTTKVSGVAAEFSGNVCAAEFYGGGANITGITHPTSVAAMTINTLGVVTAASITSLVAPHGSFTTKVSGVAGEFSGTVCAATFDGALTGNVTGDVTGDIDGAIGSFSACISATNLVAATGSFTTKVSGVAGEFSGTVCAATFDGALTGNVTGDIDGATGLFSACISATNLVAATGSFTTKVSGVASEFSGNVCAAEFYGGGANLTGVTGATSVTSFTVNQLAVVTVATFADGAVGTPSFTNTGDTDTGIFFSEADKLNISAGGVEVAELGTTGTEIVLNNGGIDLDFRVESDANQYMFFVDGGNNEVLIDGSNGLTTSDGLLHLHRASAGSISASALADELVIENNDHGGVSILTPADKHGYIMFGDPGSNVAGQIQYDHGTPAWQYIFEGVNRMYFTGTETVFNDEGGDHNFRVESDTEPYLLDIDAGSSTLSIGGQSPGVYKANIYGGGDADTTYPMLSFQGDGGIAGFRRQHGTLTTAAKEICNISTSNAGCFFIFSGLKQAGSNAFTDFGVWCGNSTSPTILGSDEQNSPDTRTYTDSSGVSLQCKMGANTYDVTCTLLQNPMI